MNVIGSMVNDNLPSFERNKRLWTVWNLTKERECTDSRFPWVETSGAPMASIHTLLEDLKVQGFTDSQQSTVVVTE